MSTDDKLPDSLQWRDDGHVSDLTVSVLADREAQLLSHDATVHVDACETCTDRLAYAARLALSVDAALHQRPVPSELRHASRQGAPVAAFVFALAVAVVGSLPALPDPARLVITLSQGLPALLRGLLLALSLVLERESATLAVLSTGAAALLIIGGWLVARRMPLEFEKGHSS